MKFSKALLPASFILLLAVTLLQAQSITPPFFIPQAGMYTQNQEVQLVAVDGAVVYYTLDGSEPDSASFRYSAPILAETRDGDPPNLLTIDRVSHGYMTYAPPKGNVQMATVIRARAYKDGVWSRSVSATYLIHPDGNERYQLPVISIATDSTNLFSHQDGIYVTGVDYENWQNTGSNRFLDMTYRGGVPANYFRRGIETEKPAHIEMFETDGRRVLAQNIGIRIHGGLSRAMRLKSLRLYSRSDYGVSRFRYQVFPEQSLDNFNRLILRPSGQDVNKTMFRDALMHRISEHLGFETMAYRPAILFINGEFWGIHNIRERYDNDYFEIKYNLGENQIDYLSGTGVAIEGSNTHYQNMLSELDAVYVSTNRRYAAASERMDMQNFTAYMLANIYANNRDWPHNNIDFWRYRSPDGSNPDAPAPLDGRWRWMMFDTDMTFGWTDTHRESTYTSDVYSNTIQRVTRPDHWSTRLLRRLLTFPEFKRQFANTHMDLMNTAYQADRVIEIIDEMASVIEPHIQEHLDRMGYYPDRWDIPQTTDDWKTAVDFMRRFASDRPDTLNEHMRIHLGFPGFTRFHVGVNDTLRGSVQINSIMVSERTPGIRNIGNPSRWSGSYFTDNPVTVTAHPESGWVFDYWAEYPDSMQTMQITPGEEDITLTAVFNQTVSIDEGHPEVLPQRILLEQNYPNPFNPSTTIRFELPEAARVQLSVYDILGRRVAVLVDQRLSPGAHQYRFEAGNLPTGHYLYRLNVDGLEFTRTMSLLK